MPSPLIILHLSDAHIGSPDYKLDMEQVLDQLTSDLQKVRDERGLQPSLIIFNGDLAYGERTGSSIKEQFAQGKEWIERIYSSLDLSRSEVPLVSVPGNHDRNVTKMAKASVAWIRNPDLDSNAVYREMENSSVDWKNFLEPELEWADFARSVRHQDLEFNDKLHMSTLILDRGNERIGLAALNSAWAAYKDGEAERGKIWIGEFQIHAALRALKECSFKVAISHHPISWLSSAEGSTIKEKIQTQFNVHLHGHEHSSWVEDQVDHLKVEAGACYQGAKKPKAYSWIVLDFNQRSAQVHLRKYEEKGAGGWCQFVIPRKTDDDGIVQGKGLFQSTENHSQIGTASVHRSHHDGKSPQSKNPQDFAELRDITSYIKVLEDFFEFRWEPWKRFNSHSKVVVYWPVRLRTPTPIHAVQCFAAAGLQRLGAEIVLCLDDLGNAEIKPKSFNSRAGNWMRSVEGKPARLRRLLFSEIIKPKTSEQVWGKVQTWLGKTDYRFDKILRISKLEDAHNLETLYKRRPRRLLTPALVWTVLDYVSREYPNHMILTLGGQDERELWEAWRDLIPLAHNRIGHIYAPALTETKDDQNRTLHMARTDLKLAWHSKQDIRRAIERDLSKGGNSFSGSRLAGWCFGGCIRLPAYLKGKSLSLEVDGQAILGVEDVMNLEVGQIGTAVSNWAAEWLL